MSNIKAIRERLELTQEALGAVMDCTQGNVGFYERDGQSIPPSRVQRLIAFAKSKGLKLTMEQVYGLAPLPKQATGQGA